MGVLAVPELRDPDRVLVSEILAHDVQQAPGEFTNPVHGSCHDRDEFLPFSGAATSFPQSPYLPMFTK
jgi:hypothetical protein